MKPLSNSKNCPNCGDNHKTKPFCLYEDGYHCFSCGVTKKYDRSFIYHDLVHIPTIEKLIGKLTYNLDDFSIISKEWLTKYYITNQHVKKFNIIEQIENNLVWLVFPTIENGEIVFYQKRCMNQRAFISSSAKKHVYTQTNNKLIVIVEDFISYARVATLFDCVCLYGTSINDEEVSYILNYYDDIFIWLDNDRTKSVNSGQVAAKKIMSKFSYAKYLKSISRFFTVHKQRVMNICTENDPKCYSDTEIKHIINGCNLNAI